MVRKPTSTPADKKGLTKVGLAELVYDLHGGLTKNEAVAVVDTILGTVKTSLLEGRKVKIQNFGVFEVTRREGRRGVSPASGESIFIPSRRGLSFRPAKKLQSAVEESGSDEG